MSGAEASGSAPPEGPPLAIPTVAPERAVSPSTPVSGEEKRRCDSATDAGQKGSGPGRGLLPAFSELSFWFAMGPLWAFVGPPAWGHRRKLQFVEEKARGKKSRAPGFGPQMALKWERELSDTQS